MDANQKREALFRELYAIAEAEAGLAASQLLDGQEDISQILRKYLNNEEAVDAFRRAVGAACNLAFQDLFTLVDGCGADLGYELALIDADAHEDLVPDNEMYHDAFSYYAFLRQSTNSA